MTDEGGGPSRRTPGEEPAKKDAGQGDRLAAAVARPLRCRVLSVLEDRGEPCSPLQIARRLDLPVSVIAYHLNVLRECGMVEPASGEGK